MTLPPSLANRAPTGEIRIGLLSDTHIMAEELPHQLEQVFSGVDLILHAGDILYPRVLDELEGIAPVLAARGDEDSDRLSDARITQNHHMALE
ncbi:MAG: metallophosphoesterase family protein, partial [Chloroflexi bacterium]|nr:metallophosphoesterase family protein [Chloroflexota bacterium]